MSAHFNALGDAPNGECWCGYPEVMDLDLIAREFSLLEELRVGGAAQRAFKAEGLAGLQTALDFVKQKFTCSQGESLWCEWGKAAGDFVGVEETGDGIDLAKVGFGKRGFARTVGTGEEVEGGRRGLHGRFCFHSAPGSGRG